MGAGCTPQRNGAFDYGLRAPIYLHISTRFVSHPFIIQVKKTRKHSALGVDALNKLAWLDRVTLG